MKGIEFWVASLTYGLSWLHVNTICSRYLRIPVPGDCWWQGCHCPQSRAGSKGVHRSHQAQVVSVFWSGTLYSWGKEKTPTLRGLYAIPLPICHSHSAMRRAGTFPSWKLSVQNESCQSCFHPGAGTAVWEVWEVTMEKVPNEAKDFVPR